METVELQIPLFLAAFTFTVVGLNFSLNGVQVLLVEQFPNNRPRTLFPDKGPGFYHGRWGVVTADFSVKGPMAPNQLFTMTPPWC